MHTQLVLRLLYVPVTVCVSTLFTCAKVTSLNYYATVATSTVEANGSLQAEQAKVCQASLVVYCLDNKKVVHVHVGK